MSTAVTGANDGPGSTGRWLTVANERPQPLCESAYVGGVRTHFAPASSRFRAERVGGHVAGDGRPAGSSSVLSVKLEKRSTGISAVRRWPRSSRISTSMVTSLMLGPTLLPW
jgi:hypothetical protein